MKLRFFVPILLAVPILAACGASNSSNSSDAASARAAAIASAVAQGGNVSTAPSSEAPSPVQSSAPSAATTCDDQTINGNKITGVRLQNGATCGDLTKVAASPQIGGETFEWAVDGFHCAAGTDTMFVCDRDNSDAEVDFTATKP
jgi:hypothetical protein